MCKKVAIVGLFLVQNYNNKLFEKHFVRNLYLIFKQDNSCDNNTSKSEINFFHVSALWKIFSYFVSSEIRASKASEEKHLYLYHVNDILE